MITWPAYTSPAPNPIIRQVSPLLACPDSIIEARAMPIEAAELLPKWVMVRAG